MKHVGKIKVINGKVVSTVWFPKLATDKDLNRARLKLVKK
jgi:hypothetical protein